MSATQCDSLVGLNAPEFKNVKKKKKKRQKSATNVIITINCD